MQVEFQDNSQLNQYFKASEYEDGSPDSTPSQVEKMFPSVFQHRLGTVVLDYFMAVYRSIFNLKSFYTPPQLNWKEVKNKTDFWLANIYILHSFKFTLVCFSTFLMLKIPKKQH